MASLKRHSSLRLSSLITLLRCSSGGTAVVGGGGIRSLQLVVLLCCLAAQLGGGRAELLGVHERTAASWAHAVDLNEDFRILWTIINQDVTFEIQARALGYVGFGFSPDGNQAGADMAIGWVDKGHTFFQDRYVAPSGAPEPLVDPSQDYMLILGYENATHTVIRFRRKLDTCDTAHDLAITNNTMRVVFMYNDEDPTYGAVTPGSLPNPSEAWRPSRSLMLTQKTLTQAPLLRLERARSLELRNEDVELPYGDDTLLWCKMFKLDKLQRKHHLIQYEPIYDTSWSMHYLQHLTLYECQGQDIELAEMARGRGEQCQGARSLPLACNAIVSSWTRGSDGFAFPPEAGYPLESSAAKYYLLETHYSNLNGANAELLHAKQMSDNSGLRIRITERLRPNDAGILSIGMDPNWRHIIPPGQQRVVSEGQCIEDCTAYAFPRPGIHIFAVMMRTHQIGRQIKLRQIRKSVELSPIAADNNIDSDYQDFRRLERAVHSLPGDRLVAECIYDSSSRNAITLGGLTMKAEICTVLTLYYPRQKKLTTCHSLPSLPTVLHSLGIEELATNSNPVVIAAPSNLAGMTLEDRLLSYNWRDQFNTFQDATLGGSFKPLCWGAHNEVVPLSEHLTGYRANITKLYKEPRRCKAKRTFATETTVPPQLELPVLHDVQSNHIAAADNSMARSSRSSIVEVLALNGAESSSLQLPFFFSRWSVCALLLIAQFIS